MENISIERLKPGVKKGWLHMLSGVMWSGVGVLLCHFAYEWLAAFPFGSVAVFILAGVVLAAVIYSYGFSRLANKNITRICSYTEKAVCLFAFQKWSSYPLVLVMIAMGIFLRKYAPIPKTYLSVLYIGLGGGLFLSSLHYYWHLVRQK